MIRINIEQTFVQKVGLRAGLIVLTLLSTSALPLALPNELFYYGNPVLGFFCLTAYFLALTYAPSFRFTVLLGVLFGGTTTVLAHYWLLYFGDFSVWTITGVTVGYMGYHALFAPLLYGLIRFDSKYRVFIIALAWTFYEYLKSTGFLAFPWGILPHTVATLKPFIQIADVTGIWGISFIVALINAFFAELVISFRSLTFLTVPAPRFHSEPHRILFELRPLSLKQLIRMAIFAGILILVVLGYGFRMLLKDFSSNDILKVLLVQPNEDPWATVSEELVLNKAMWLTSQGIPSLPEARQESASSPGARQSVIQELERHIPDEELSVMKQQSGTRKSWQTVLPASEASKPDLIVWSETSFPYYIRENIFDIILQRVPQPVSFSSFIKSTGAYFILGAPFKPDSSDDAQNAALYISPEGKLIDHYAKQHPVPIAEAIPFWNFRLVRSFFQNNLGLTSSGWETGKEYTLFEVPLQSGKTLTFGTPICFEDTFPYLCRNFISRGADFLVNITNVSWSKQKSAEIQMLIASLFRTIENRRTLVRATNGGVTSIINPQGEVLQQLELFVADTLYAEVPIYTDSNLTFYTQWGDYLPVFFAYMLLLFLIWHNFFKKLYG